MEDKTISRIKRYMYIILMTIFCCGLIQIVDIQYDNYSIANEKRQDILHIMKSMKQDTYINDEITIARVKLDGKEHFVISNRNNEISYAHINDYEKLVLTNNHLVEKNYHSLESFQIFVTLFLIAILMNLNEPLCIMIVLGYITIVFFACLFTLNLLFFVNESIIKIIVVFLFIVLDDFKRKVFSKV